MAPDNNQLSRRILDEVWNRRNLDIIDELVAPDFVFHDPMAPSQVGGVEDYRQFVRENLKAFPDLRLTIEDVICSEDIVATRWRATGTHQGELGGHAPTGKTMTITGINFARIVDGKFVESWGNWDALGMMRQLGLLSANSGEQAA